MDRGGRRGAKDATSEADTAPRPLRAHSGSLLGDLVDIDPQPTKRLPRIAPREARPPGDGPRWPLAFTAHGPRDPRLDFLRGLCLIAMIAANLGGASWLRAATGGGAFLISAAEGFVFIAGSALGLTAARGTVGGATRRIVARLWILYRLAIVITLGFAVLAATLDRLILWYPLPAGLTAAYAGRPDAFAIGALTLTIAYHGAEWLVLFIVLLAVAPLALLACAEGRGWIVPVVSGAVYLAAQRYPEQLSLPFATPAAPAAWQLLFFGGLTIAYHRAWMAERLARVRPYWLGYAAATIGAAIALAVLFARGALPLWLHDPQSVEVARATLTPRRLLPVVIYLQAFYLLVTWFWVPLRAVFGWFILSFGRNALWISLLHLPLIVLFRNLPALASLDRTLGTVAQVAVIAALWGTIKLRDWANGAAYRGALPTRRVESRKA